MYVLTAFQQFNIYLDEAIGKMKIFLRDNEEVSIGLPIFAGFFEVTDKQVVTSGQAVAKCSTQIHFATSFGCMLGCLIKKGTNLNLRKLSKGRKNR
jgi:hypothetical protein